MAGTVGVTADATARYTEFTECLAGLLTHMPVNTQLQFKVGPDRGKNRDWLVEQSLARGSEWILFLDDDHSFPPHLLVQLLSHEQPIVSSLYLLRQPPFYPIAYESKNEEGLYTALDLKGRPHSGLVPVVAAGTGGMLIRSEVFYDMEPPWFLHTDQHSEDLYFCDRAVAAGFPIFVDLEARLGHITPINVVPAFTDAGWLATLVVGQAMNVGLPIGDEPEDGEITEDTPIPPGEFGGHLL
jgi:hypothetical protein